ncbi:hypothetical protein ACIP95_07375 [Micromonospora parva]|uniref:hypothetical protein n=1 Tax=Micromonospora parva TaxID=1464048 RepID=UPI00381409CB
MTTAPALVPGGLSQRTFALVVGVQDYSDLGPDFARKGIADDAVGFAEVLLRFGVPAANIRLLLSAEEIPPMPHGLEVAGPATSAAVRAEILRLPQHDGDLLWVFWAGHGWYADLQSRLLLADATAAHQINISFEELVTLCGSEFLPGFGRQVFTVDACRLPNARLPRAESLPEKEEGKSECWQAIMYAAPPRRAAGYSYGDRGGLFSRSLLDALRRADTAVWPPSLADLSTTVLAGMKDRGSSDSEPTTCYFSPETGVNEPGRRLVAGPAADATKAYELAGYVIPSGWSPGRLVPGCSERTAVRLDLRWILDRTPAHGVVAEPSNADLATDLNSAELVLREHSRMTVPQRRWLTVEPARSGDPWRLSDADSAFLDAGGPDEDHAFVLRVDVEVAAEGPDAATASLCRAWTAYLRDRFPASSVVVAVRAPTPVDAMLTAQRLAEVLTRDGTGWLTVTRFRPGERPTTATPLPSGSTPATPVLPAVVHRLRQEAVRRGLKPVLPPLPGYAGPDLDSVSPSLLADLVISELEDGDGRVAETDLMCAVRDFLPGWYPQFLTASGARRTGAGWVAGLTVACAFDADVGRWLDSIGDRRVAPTDLPAPLTESVVEALVLAALRDPAARPKLPGWRSAFAGRAIADLVRVMASRPATPGDGDGTSSAPTPAELSREAALLTGRIGVAAAIVRAARPADRLTDAYMAALRACPMSADLIELLTGPPDVPSAVAMAVGLRPVDPRTEQVLIDRIAELRRVLHYLPAHPDGECA